MSSTVPPLPRQEVRAFWTGPSLSLYEELSLRSFLASGARVQLFTYNNDLVVPDGVELINANEILPGPVYAFRHAAGDKSLALHSDLFRYVAVEKYGGWYLDLDIIFIGRELPASPIYIARETAKVINGAVMKFPAHSPLLQRAIEEARRLLPETATSTSHEARVLIGPSLMTRLLSEFSLEHVVRPRSQAYEIGYDEIPALFDPASRERLQERVADSDFTHLWNEVWRWVRIPKNYGPPAGTYLDSLFCRVGMKISSHARLSYGALSEWFREHRLLQDVKYRIGQDRMPADAMDQLAGWFEKVIVPRSAPSSGAVAIKRATASGATAAVKPPISAFAAATAPQVVQTFWHGDVMGPYQLLCLRSFFDRGHQVEVFSYDSQLRLPGWIERRNAAEILPRNRILRPLNDERFAVHANLFRYALMAMRGGWWIDPDVVLLQPDLPKGEIFIGGPDIFGLTSTGLLRFPKGHPLMKIAMDQTLTLGEAIEAWEASGAALLTDLIRQLGTTAEFYSREPLGPVSWFEVPALFDPSQRDQLEILCREVGILQLHDDVWRRSGVPQWMAPPLGSFLEGLVEKHGIEPGFVGRMHFDEVNRWIQHMYECIRLRDAQNHRISTQKVSG
jgi:Glycosyltransferase sugar-binding region containing DXD motif